MQATYVKIPEKIVYEILNGVAKACNTNTDNILSKNRQRYLCVYPRHLCFLFTRCLTDYTLAEIGFLYDKDHASVKHGCKSILEKLDVKDMGTYEMFVACRTELTAGKPERIYKLQDGINQLKKERR